MDSIMTYITQCDQILYGILATILMLLFMMKLPHFSRVIHVELKAMLRCPFLGSLLNLKISQ